jgi:hypothetical protein
MNTLSKKLTQKILIGLAFGLAVTAGISLGLTFTEPESGPSGFREPLSANDKGDYLAYGRGWVASSSGDGSTALTQSTCESASGWEWFEDANGDGDTTDQEDGICVKTTAVSSGNLTWNGNGCSSQQDNSYIADYTCSGTFPNGTVATYSGINSSCTADNTWNDGDCALCQADCYDGVKNLPDQGGYTTGSEAEDGGCEGPLTTEVLKNWVGTRLPTSRDFFGFCGATSGDSDTTAGNSSVPTADLISMLLTAIITGNT